MVTANDQQIAYDLRDLVSKLNRSLRKQAGKWGELSIAEENVIRALLLQEEISPSELCIQLDISSQFMSQVLNRLEELGHISRKPSTTDKRKSLVSLSKEMMHQLEQKRKQKEAWRASIISKKYNKQQKEQIAQTLELLAQLHDDK